MGGFPDGSVNSTDQDAEKMRPCEICGTDFQPYHSKQKVCPAKSCRKEASNKRVRKFMKTEKGKALRKRNNESVPTQAAKRKYHASSRFGITAEEYNDWFLKAGHECELCGSTTKLALDHDHVTGKIRGVLCVNCNTSIGKLGDSVEGLRKALSYLEERS